jgi:hypothetical protein
MSGKPASSADWADEAADELLYLLALVHDDRTGRELLAAKLREIESTGALRGAEQVQRSIARAI